VLVVEKEQGLRKALCDLLQAKGYEVHAVSSRAEGFDALDSLCPDLLVMDDPGQQRTYRLVWLKEQDQPDVRVELLTLQPQSLTGQLGDLLRDVA